MAPRQLVWLITGTSTGVGRDLTLAALKRGDKVIATARNELKIQDLRDVGADTLQLDVTSPLEVLHEVAKKAISIHGRVDVLVNNAGYMVVGTLEENTPEETLQQFNTNVFGALNVCRAFLPYMRKEKSGTIAWLGSIGGYRGTPTAGLYCATKYAVRSLSEALHLEISPLGLRSVCFEPAYFRTAFLTGDHRGPYQSRIADYAEIGEKMNNVFLAYNGKQPGDPKKLAEVILDIVRGEGVGEGREPPLALLLGSDGYDIAHEILDRKLNEIKEWKDVTKSTDFPKGM